MQLKYYYYEKWYPSCYALHRPDGTRICFLQGDDALEFEKTLEELEKIEFPSGCFKSYEHLLSVNIDQYDC